MTKNKNKNKPTVRMRLSIEFERKNQSPEACRLEAKLNEMVKQKWFMSYLQDVIIQTFEEWYDENGDFGVN